MPHSDIIKQQHSRKRWLPTALTVNNRLSSMIALCLLTLHYPQKYTFRQPVALNLNSVCRSSTFGKCLAVITSPFHATEIGMFNSFHDLMLLLCVCGIRSFCLYNVHHASNANVRMWLRLRDCSRFRRKSSANRLIMWNVTITVSKVNSRLILYYCTRHWVTAATTNGW